MQSFSTCQDCGRTTSPRHNLCEACSQIRQKLAFRGKRNPSTYLKEVDGHDPEFIRAEVRLVRGHEQPGDEEYCEQHIKRVAKEIREARERAMASGEANPHYVTRRPYATSEWGLEEDD